MKKQYISGHDAPWFFKITGNDLRKLRELGHFINNGSRFHYYDLAELKKNFTIRKEIPNHIITTS